ncbi:MAG: CDP-diacylglycerol--serine O-phosphatidyltransferase [Rhodospirillales bacterium]|nr:CDP-diacylglycerol--serine O-phosphatidyltransferase [Rhodospirillales bacterium]MDH3910019.1 CDP-diacylglycerol--serine O-phosphatidyltransferase [Rhodospirillales bacterium]MDH3916589.1 CDP-diacylglycerol--serine O-phosphatidyltransferase [Rhodospirillales bacterium]MDH3967438.1 CDP-diacylglycerol--serine O-phosphatidyltransferase [Rhodospirillales bacterium]
MEMQPRGRLRGHSLNRLIPNILTILALCAGITAMRFGIQGGWEHAVIAIVVAAVLDGLDGRIARALGASSRFGAELDSLSDFVAFGVAPAFLVYLWSLQTAGGFGWALALLFAVCCALRLARFNTTLESEVPEPAWAKNFFVGVPAPLGGLLALIPMIVGLETESEVFASPVINGLVIAGISALMVSRVPTIAIKQAKVPARYVVFVLLGVGAFAAFLISTPWVTLAVSAVVYLASIPYTVVLYRRLERRHPSEALEEIEEEEETGA